MTESSELPNEPNVLGTDAMDSISSTVGIPANPPPAVVLTDTERLTVENLQLHLLNCDKSAQGLVAQLESLKVRRDAIQVRYIATIDALAEKYGFDVSLVEMDAETGVIRPRSKP
jgi:hypothetical protein